MKITQEQMGKMSYKERKRFGDWIVSVPHGPYSRFEHRKFVDNLPTNVEYHTCVEGKISGGNGVGYPGYYDEEVLAVYQPLAELKDIVSPFLNCTK